jgi:hypothetical protein
MPRVVTLDPFRQKAFPAALAPARESGATAFGAHPRTKPVLTLASSFRWLISAFHKTEKSARCELKAVTLGWGGGLSMSSEPRMSI